MTKPKEHPLERKHKYGQCEEIISSPSGRERRCKAGVCAAGKQIGRCSRHTPASIDKQAESLQLKAATPERASKRPAVSVYMRGPLTCKWCFRKARCEGWANVVGNEAQGDEVDEETKAHIREALGGDAIGLTNKDLQIVLDNQECPYEAEALERARELWFDGMRMIVEQSGDPLLMAYLATAEDAFIRRFRSRDTEEVKGGYPENYVVATTAELMGHFDRFQTRLGMLQRDAQIKDAQAKGSAVVMDGYGGNVTNVQVNILLRELFYGGNVNDDDRIATVSDLERAARALPAGDGREPAGGGAGSSGNPGEEDR